MKNLILVCLLMAFTACSKEEISESATPEEKFQPELAYPDMKGIVSEVFYAGMQFPVEEIAGEYVYQGDILFSKKMVSKKNIPVIFKPDQVPHQKSTGRTDGMWPDNTVYYTIENNLENKDRVYNAIEHWQANTNLKFVERKNERNYLYFRTGSGCSSYVGMIGGRQNINLAPGCSTGSTIHEIGHAVGLWHEQSRVDRDKYITIHYDNIQAGSSYNFDTYADQGISGEEYTDRIDFKSIMMYPPFAFSKNGKPTITTKEGFSYPTQRNRLSSGDVKGLNIMYPDKGITEPQYINGEDYRINGVTVRRHNDEWWYWSRASWSWRQVISRGSHWVYRQ